MITISPKISIVTPSFNQGKYLEKTILSVLEQGYPDLEYIIIDGGSSDESVEIIKRYADRLAYWVSEPDRGQSHAINKGFEQATGEIFGWLNSDDWYHPGALQVVAEVFAANPEAGAVVGAGEMMDELTGDIYLVESFPVMVETLYGAVDKFFMQPSCFFTGQVWAECGPLDEELHLAMDLDLWFRIAKKHVFVLTETVLSTSLAHQAAKTRALAAQSHVDASLVIMRHGGVREGRARLVAFVEELLRMQQDLLAVSQRKSFEDEVFKRNSNENLALQTELSGALQKVNRTNEELVRVKYNNCEMNELLKERDEAIEALRSSMSWKITAPLRTIFATLMVLLGLNDKK